MICENGANVKVKREQQLQLLNKNIQCKISQKVVPLHNGFMTRFCHYKCFGGISIAGISVPLNCKQDYGRKIVFKHHLRNMMAFDVLLQC